MEYFAKGIKIGYFGKYCTNRLDETFSKLE